MARTESSFRTLKEDTATVTFGDDPARDSSSRAAGVSAPPVGPLSSLQVGVPVSPPNRRAASVLPPPPPRAPSIPASLLYPSTHATAPSSPSAAQLLPPAPESDHTGDRRAAPPTLPSPGLSAYVAQLRARSKARSSSGSIFSHFFRSLAQLRRLFGGRDPGTEISAPRPVASSYSGLDTLRPYVGSRPQILVGMGEVDGPSPRFVRPGGETRFRDFFVGVAVASFVFVAVTLSSRLVTTSAEARHSSAPVHLDADAIPRGALEEEPLSDRAALGDHDALRRLKERAPSSLLPDEAAAISRGEEIRARRHATEVVTALGKQRTFTSGDRDEFFRHAGNQRTFREALLAMANNRSEAGPDLIYQVMRAYRHQADISDFARAILMTPPVYKYASPALTVVIDAETLSECNDVRQLVDRVREDGDARAVRHMAKFAKTTGCGEHGIHDCYPCLRGDRALEEALRAAQDRRAPY